MSIIMPDFDIRLVSSTHSAQDKWLRAFSHGLDAIGQPYRWMDPTRPEDCDLAIGWGYGTLTSQNQKNNDRDYLTLGKGFIGNQKQWCSAGFNGKNAGAEYIEIPGPDRFNHLFSHSFYEMKPAGAGSYFILVGENPKDIDELDYRAWFNKVVEELEAKQTPTYFLQGEAPDDLECPFLKIMSDVNENIRGAELVISYSSNWACQAVMLGTAAVCPSPTAMINSAYSHDRPEWLARLAWKQWSLQELKNGLCWEVLSSRYTQHNQIGTA